MTLRINGDEGGVIYARLTDGPGVILIDDSILAKVRSWMHDHEGNVVFELDDRLLVVQSIDLVFD